MMIRLADRFRRCATNPLRKKGKVPVAIPAKDRYVNYVLRDNVDFFVINLS